MKCTIKTGFLLFILQVMLCLSPDHISAQMVETEAGSDSLQRVLLPVAGFDSDLGFIGGGLYNRLDKGGSVEPFNSLIQSTATATTKGTFSFNFRYEKNRSFDSALRSEYDLFFQRFTVDYYFGIGNGTEFDEEKFDDEFYFFESLSFGGSYRGRWPIALHDDSRLDWVFGLSTRYEIPYIRQNDSKFNIDRPLGNKGGWVNSVKTGIIWENRNSEFDPTSGNRIELVARAAPSFLLSDFAMLDLNGEIRYYIRVLDWVTVANRLQIRHTSGDVPYWELSKLGSETTLRGYPLNRFLGTSSVAYTLELRKWLFHFPRHSIKVGGQIFTDTGRVFNEGDSFEDLFRGYKQTFGLGGAFTLFSPDVIFRGDVGFSEDLFRVYIGIGYTF